MSQTREIIRVDSGTTRHPDRRMREPLLFSACEGEQIAIVGGNAAGKSRLVDIIIGRYPLLRQEVKYDFSPSAHRLASDNIKYITFRDSYGDNDGTYYYQLRWNQGEIDEGTPTVGDLLDQTYRLLSHPMPQLRELLYEMFHLQPLLDKYIITLSSGELRKFQLTKALLSGPRVLIMDNPFIGLDASTREQLASLLRTLVENTDLLTILVLSKTDDIPDYITHVVPVSDLSVDSKLRREDYIPVKTTAALPKEWHDWLTDLPEKDLSEVTFYPQHGGEVLSFHNVSIRYGSRTILKDLNWTVGEGERWALTGDNGSGKSTLLSLVCADNPQAYACDISLFGHARGSGESIWDIKRHIGYVSPEMHRAYLRDLPAIDIVASGLKDSVGLYCRPRPEERETCLQWLGVFGVDSLADRTFLSLSSGEQRLCLLARAFVKDPELLILDEPLHGLDNLNRQRVREIIETFCQRPHKTLVMVTHYDEELPPCIDHRLRLEKQT